MRHSQGECHRQMQAMLDLDDCGIEAARGHGKTQQVIPRLAWEIGHDPTIRIKYVQHSMPASEMSVQQLKAIVESDVYGLVFPHIQPGGTWGKQAFRVTYKGSHLQRDPTAEACSIMGRVSGRFDFLVGDDVCDTRNSIRSPTDRESVKSFWKNTWIPQLDAGAGKRTRIWRVFTPYHKDDLTAEWRKKCSEAGTYLRLDVKEVDGKFVSPWHEVWTDALLRQQLDEMGPTAFARAYRLIPTSELDLTFRPEWIDDAMYRVIPPGHRLGDMMAAFDFAVTKANPKTEPDWSVCLIAHVSQEGHVYVIDMLRDRMTFPEFRRAAIERCRQHAVVRAIGEGNGVQAGFVQEMNEVAPFPVLPTTDRTERTELRAAAQQSAVEAGRLHLPMDGQGRLLPKFQPLYDEICGCPLEVHDDCLDTAIDLLKHAVTGRVKWAEGSAPGSGRRETMYGV